MATVVFDSSINQWYVRYASGQHEACANSATAKTLARRANS